jgi:hypothetical protein
MFNGWHGLKRRPLGIASLAVAIGVLAAVQASASGKAVGSRSGSAAALPSVAALVKQLGAHARPNVVLTHSGGSTTISCGSTLTAKGTYTLTASLQCTGTGDGVDITGNNIVLNLAGFAIVGQPGNVNGVALQGRGDKVEGGSVVGWQIGVDDQGPLPAARGSATPYASFASPNETVQNIDAVGNVYGISVEPGAGGSEVKQNVAAENSSDGIAGEGGSDYFGNHLLHNGGYGLITQTEQATVSDNIANGNGYDGISTNGEDILTGNVADFNDRWGIYAPGIQHDGGKNTATGNTQHEQCLGVVCSPQ